MLNNTVLNTLRLRHSHQTSTTRAKLSTKLTCSFYISQ